MKVVTLLSGGLDSSLMLKLLREENIEQYPLMINYGQLNLEKETQAAKNASQNILGKGLEVVELKDFSRLVPSGITDSSLDIVEDAFLPGRNLLLLLVASSYAYKVDADAVSIGLLNEDTAIFPDQSDSFIYLAETLINKALDRSIKIMMPLRDFYKDNVVRLAKDRGLSGTYSCHAGGESSCGKCISCLEFKGE